MRTWQTEFPDAQIPAEVQTLVAAGKLADTSWHNDACPSFEMTRHRQTARLWVEYPDLAERETKARRFHVSFLGTDLGTCLEARASTDSFNGELPLVYSDEVKDVLAFVAAFEAHAIAPHVHDVASARAFVRWCVKVLGTGFHPDTPFGNYVAAAGESVFAPCEALRLDFLMDRTCDFIDPYALGVELFKELTR
jgi:hypothetical protein